MVPRSIIRWYTTSNGEDACRIGVGDTIAELAPTSMWLERVN